MLVYNKGGGVLNMKKAKILALASVFVLGLSLVGCGNKKVEPGTYIAETAVNKAYAPTLSIFEDNTYQMNVGLGQYFKGTVEVKKDQLILKLEENVTYIENEALEEVTFTISDEDTIVINEEITDYVESGTEFNA